MHNCEHEATVTRGGVFMGEKVLERKLVEAVKAAGGIAPKFVSPTKCPPTPKVSKCKPSLFLPSDLPWQSFGHGKIYKESASYPRPRIVPGYLCEV
jgi:hypothetical protein